MLKRTAKHSVQTNRFSILSRGAAIFLTVFLALPLLAWVANTERVGFADSQQPQPNRVAAEAKVVAGLAQPVTVEAEGRGTSRLKFRDGRDVAVEFKGAANPEQAVPTAIAAGDFNSDGYDDVIGGYSTADGGGGGMITLYRTNSDAIAPRTEKIHAEMMNGRFPAPFLPEAVSFAIPEAADFIGVGDFNRDGFKDVLTAARGSLNLHLLAGDGRGNFRYERRIELPGAVTTMLVEDVNNYDGMADVIVGIGKGYAPKALIYHNSDEMFSEKPVEIDLPAEATAFAVGQMDSDVLKDLVIAAGNEVLVSRGFDQTTQENPKTKLERIALPSNARSVATGEFVFDRETRTEIAVLLEDGTVDYLTRGNVDRRPYSVEEQKVILEKRRNRDYKGLDAFKKSSLRRGGGNDWAIAETPITSKGRVGEAAKLVTAQLAGLSTDDLMVVDAAGNKMQLVQSSKGEMDSQSSVAELDTESEVVAAVAVRLNIDTAPDIVLLRKDSAAPTVMLSPTATINVSAAATDVIANNGVCSLREAIINANHDNQSGSTDCAAGSGADTIMMPAMTYTLALGSFDDDQLLDGYEPTTGDLDIADDDGANSDGGADAIGDLTIQGVAGSTIIQAGTTTTNGIDRVFDVNNFVSPGTAVNATFTNLIIRHGKGVIAPFGYFTPGGGIQFDGFNVPTGDRSAKTLTLNNTTVTLNRAAGQGGGILALNGAANFANSAISSNRITDTDDVAPLTTNWTNAAGGGMSYDGGGNSGPARTFQMSGTTTFNANVIDPSDAGGANFGQGGAARLAGGTGATITGSITNNDAQSFGGGFSVDTIPAVTISNSTITGNDANTNGGGIFSKPLFANGTLSTLTMTGNTINNNRADADSNATGIVDGSGGGIFQERGNLTISGGTIGGSGTPNTAFNGGGIGHAYEGAPTASIINNTTITIDNTPITFNTARGDGGGIFHNSLNQTTSSTLTLGNSTNVDLKSNLANVNGGGISVSNSAVANLTRATVQSNKADFDNNNTGDGGGVFAATSGSVTITGATSPIGGASAALGNTARNGGGIANAGGTITISGTGATITRNTATGTGGGISNNSGTLSAFTTATIANNTATGNGGGIFNSGTLGAITSPTLDNNSAATGGGIFNSSGALVITNGSVSTNTATTGKGGGIEHSGASGTVTSVSILTNTKSGILITGTGSLDAVSNTITGNGGDGIGMTGTGVGSHFNTNTIHSNTELGIDLSDNGVTPNDAGDADTGPNNLQNFPVLNYVRRGTASAGIASVTLNSAPGKYRIQYYANTTCDVSGFGEGEVVLASVSEVVTVPAGGTLTFLSSAALPYGTREQITATATSDPNNNNNFDDDGSTSEFSACRQVNTLPTISATAGNTRQQGSPGTNSQIATVNDIDQTENTLVVTVNGGASATVNGVTLSNIVVSAAGVVTADIVASCSATNATFTLRVTDDALEFNEATLSVAVTANTAPTAGNYPNTLVNAGSSGTIVTPDAAPTDNGSIASVTATATSPAGFTGTFVGNTTTGAVTINNAAPFGVYTVTVVTMDNCGLPTNRTFTLTVNAIPTITAQSGVTRQQGSPATNSQIATVNDADQTEDTLVVTVRAVGGVAPGTGTATVNGVTVSNIAVNPAGVVTADVVASCSATNASFTLRVTDSNGAFSEATLSVTVTANTAPTVGTYGATNLNIGGGTTVTPTSAPGDNGSVATATAAAPGFTGTFSVSTSTGIVTIANAGPAGTYTVTVTFTDNCTLATTRTFTLTVVAPPTIAKSFSPTSAFINGISTLTITITNPAANTVALTGVGVTDTFPTGLEVDATPGATNSCATGTFAPVAAATSISISGATIPVNTTCTFSVKVKGTTPGAKLNTTGNVTSTNGGNGGTASATLTVNSLEADVDPPPSGNGLVQSSDVVQMRLFLNCTGIPNAMTDEFQRADSSPFDAATNTYGDGKIQSDDVVQARRYQNLTDAPRAAAGPTGPVVPRCGQPAAPLQAGKQTEQVSNTVEETGLAPQTVAAPEGVLRQLRVQNASGGSPSQVTVNILADAAGDEAGYGFTVNYVTSILTNPVVAIGTAGGMQSCNTITSPGQIFCGVDNFPTNRTGNALIGEIAPGTSQVLITITFTVPAGITPQTTPVTLTDVNASRDTPPLLLSIGSQNGTVTITGTTAAEAGISGHIRNTTGAGLIGVTVQLIDASSGETRTTQSGAGGIYRFENLSVGVDYVVTPQLAKHTFSPASKHVSLVEELTEMDFTAVSKKDKRLL